MKLDNKMLQLLSIVIETYIERGEPIGSKFLHSLDHIDFAPSTLRKYLNHMEHDGLLYQPYSSAGRVPTSQGLELYIQDIIASKHQKSITFDIDLARTNIKGVVETLGNHCDGVVVGFLQNDEYYYLGINNLLRQDLLQDYQIIKDIVGYIESKQIIQLFAHKLIKTNKIGYHFIKSQDADHTGMISIVYVKVSFGGYDGMLAILGPVRVNYRTNVALLKKFLATYNLI